MTIQLIRTKEDRHHDQTFYILFDKVPYQGATIYYGFSYPSISNHINRGGTKLLYAIFDYFKQNPSEIRHFSKKGPVGKELFLEYVHKKVSTIGFRSQVDRIRADNIAEIVDDLKNYVLERFDEDA